MRERHRRWPPALLALLATLVLAPVPARAGETLDADGAAELALAHSPLLAAAGSSVAAAEAERALARTGWTPRVQLTEQWLRSDDPVFVFGGKLRQGIFGASDFDVATLNTPDALTDAATQLGLQQNVWDADRTRLGLRAAELGVTAAGLDLQRRREETAFAARSAFWDVVLAEALLGVARDGESAAQAHLELAAGLVDEGLAVPSDRLSAEVRRAEVRALRIRAESGVAVARANLARVLGLGREREFDLRPVEPDAAAVDQSPQALIDAACAARADLQTLDRRIEQARLGERLARAGRLPVIGAGGHYELHGTYPLDDDGTHWAVGLSLRVPLFDGFETRARVHRARAERERIESLRQALADGIALEVRAALAERDSAIERRAVAAAAVDLAVEALRIVRERYAEGLAVIVELLGAEAAHTQARASAVEARRDVALAGARLDLALGRTAGAGTAGAEERP